MAPGGDRVTQPPPRRATARAERPGADWPARDQKQQHRRPPDGLGNPDRDIDLGEGPEDQREQSQEHRAKATGGWRVASGEGGGALDRDASGEGGGALDRDASGEGGGALDRGASGEGG